MNNGTELMLDRDAVSMLLYIEKHPGCNIEGICKKDLPKSLRDINFLDPVLDALYSERLIAIHSPYNRQAIEASDFRNNWNAARNEPLYITWKGRKIVEDYKEQKFHLWAPTILSIIAIAISLFTLLLDYALPLLTSLLSGVTQ